MQDGWKAVWSIPYVSVAFFPSLKHNFIAYRSSKVSDCIFEIHQMWQSGFSRVYANSCCSCSFEREIIKIGQSSHKMYSNNILNFQESMTNLNAHTKNVWNLIVCTSYLTSIHWYIPLRFTLNECEKKRRCKINVPLEGVDKFFLVILIDTLNENKTATPEFCVSFWPWLNKKERHQD